MIGWWAKWTFRQVLFNSRYNCPVSCTFYMRKLKHAGQCLEELQSVPDSLAWAQALNFCFSLQCGEKNSSEVLNVPSLMAVASISSGRTLSFTDGCPWRFCFRLLRSLILHAFLYIISSVIHSHELSYHLIAHDFTFFSKGALTCTSCCQLADCLLPGVYHKHVKVNHPKPNSLVAS